LGSGRGSVVDAGAYLRERHTAGMVYSGQQHALCAVPLSFNLQTFGQLASA